jgi:phospholipid/cholesterol/gamma-HCH transport system substrate-binding protein
MVLAPMVDPAIRKPGVLLRRAVTALVVVVVLGALVLAYGQGMFSGRIKVSAIVDDAGGALTAGSDVKSQGVIIGEVTSISSEDGDVRIGLSVEGEHARELPRDVQARILPATVFGTTFVDLVAGSETVSAGSEATGLRDGQTIQQDRSTKSIELQDTLDSTDRVLSAIDPAELSTTLSRVADALDGRGAALGGTLETLDGYLGRLEPHLPLLQEDMRLLGINLQVLAETSPDLLKALDNSLTTTRTIVDKRQEFSTSLTRANGLVETADQFLRDQQDQIIATLANSAITFQALFDHRKGLAGGFQSFVTFAERASAGFSDGPFLHTDVYIKTGGDMPYTGADCTQFGSAKADNCLDGATEGTAAVAPEADAPSVVTPTPGRAGSGLLGRIEELLKNAQGTP